MIFTLIKRWLTKARISTPGKVLGTLFGALVLNIGFGVGFYFAERDTQEGLSLLDSVWWAMVTMTTVGYGDYFPQTTIGRFCIAYPCFLLGIGLIGYLLGSLADSLISHGSRKRKGTLSYRMKNHIIICHCPSIAKISKMVSELRAVPGQENSQVIVISDQLESLPEEFSKQQISFVHGDPVDEQKLQQANIEHASGVFILARDPNNASSDARSFSIGTIIEMIEDDVKRPIHTVVELVSERSKRMLDRSSVDGYIVAEGVSDHLLVQEYLQPGINSAVTQLLTNTQGSQLYTCPTKLNGRALIDVQSAALQHPSTLQVIGLIRGQQTLLNPAKNTQIEPSDQLVVLAETSCEFSIFEQTLL